MQWTSRHGEDSRLLARSDGAAQRQVDAQPTCAAAVQMAEPHLHREIELPRLPQPALLCCAMVLTSTSQGRAVCLSLQRPQVHLNDTSLQACGHVIEGQFHLS